MDGVAAAVSVLLIDGDRSRGARLVDLPAERVELAALEILGELGAGSDAARSSSSARASAHSAGAGGTRLTASACPRWDPEPMGARWPRPRCRPTRAAIRCQ